MPLTILLVSGSTFLLLYTTSQAAVGDINPFASWRFYGAWLIQLLTLALAKLAVVQIVEADRLDEAPTAGSLAAALGRFALPAMAAELVFTLGMAVGFAALIIPGVIAMLAWYVFMPALVIERTGVRGAFARSTDLTRGRRGQLFGVVLVIGVMVVLTGVAAQLVMRLFDAPLVDLGVRALVGGLTQAFSLTAAVVIYWRLRRLREGLEEDRVATVFS